jgi:type IV fimbrial biogenesis protein FimT
MPKSSSGFTLIELMIVLVIFGVMAAIAIPQFSQTAQSSAVTSQTNSIIGFMKLARSEAVTRRQITTVCASTDLLTCNGSDMSRGAIILQGATLLKVLPAANGSLSSAGTASMTFSPDGTSNGGSWTVVHSGGGAASKQVTVNVAGRTTYGVAP